MGPPYLKAVQSRMDGLGLIFEREGPRSQDSPVLEAKLDGSKEKLRVWYMNELGSSMHSIYSIRLGAFPD